MKLLKLSRFPWRYFAGLVGKGMAAGTNEEGPIAWAGKQSEPICFLTNDVRLRSNWKQVSPIARPDPQSGGLR